MGLTPAEQAIYDELRAKAEPEPLEVAEVLAVEAVTEVAELEAEVVELRAVVEAEQDRELIEAVAESAAVEAAADAVPAAATVAADVAEVVAAEVAAEVVADLLEAVEELTAEAEDTASLEELPEPEHSAPHEDESPAERHWLYRTRKHPFRRAS